MKDAINPNHYKQGNIEVIDFILDQKMDYLEGNVIKYVSRYKFKNGLEDLKKARWYLDRIIAIESDEEVASEKLNVIIKQMKGEMLNEND